jgi:hypothetical protein
MHALRSPAPLPDLPSEFGWFCGHCAESPAAPEGRVCPSCGLGLIHRTRADAVPKPDQPFLIIDSTLSIQAMSRAAEELLEINEGDAVNRLVTNVLLPADVEDDDRPRSHGLAGAITNAGSSDGPATQVFVRPATTFGVRLRARISACGPPTAALLTLE